MSNAIVTAKPTQVKRRKGLALIVAIAVPQGDQLVFRSERTAGGLFVVPALGGPERRVSDFGYKPRWSPDGSQILFTSAPIYAFGTNVKIYVAGLDGRKPVEALPEFLAKFELFGDVGWYPDGKRISVSVEDRSGSSWWTAPLDGGSPVASELNPTQKKYLEGMGRFVWAPSGKALYFEGFSSGGVTNLWKVEVDPESFKWLTEPERLTSGTGRDSNPSVLRDGKKLAFSACSMPNRILSIPFDDATGRTVGAPESLRSDSVTLFLDLSYDGTKLAFAPYRDLTSEIWVKSFEDHRETSLLTHDQFNRGFPRWSRDGKFLVYQRARMPSKDDVGLVILPGDGGDDGPVPPECFPSRCHRLCAKVFVCHSTTVPRCL